MAPFSICSICTARTRKVIKDPKTLKNIYVCPNCFMANKVQKKNIAKAPGNQNQILNIVQNLPNEQPKQPKLVAPSDSGPKVTPPVMQVVYINNRKYVAVSATAADK